MHLSDKQRKEIHDIIEIGKNVEYKKFNKVIAKAVKEWKAGKKTDEQAYNKIYKKVIKNEHHLVHRYADLDDLKSLRTLAEIYVDNIISMDDFIKLDHFVKKEIHKIAGIKDVL